MTIDVGIATLGEAIGAALESAGFLGTALDLAIDASDAVPPSGDETTFVSWAALTRGQTQTVRALLGGPDGPRYVVEHRAMLDMAWAGPERVLGKDMHALGVAAIAALPQRDPTLSGRVERFFIERGEDQALPPNGWSSSLICAFRIRSSDPLGLTE